jgi:Transposase, Mutator family
VVATSYLLGVSTRRVEKLVEQLGIAQLSKSQVSEMATQLDAQVEAFRNRPLDSSHYTFVWLDALAIKVREHGRTVNVHALVAGYMKQTTSLSAGPGTPGRDRQISVRVTDLSSRRVGWSAHRGPHHLAAMRRHGAPRSGDRVHQPQPSAPFGE